MVVHIFNSSTQEAEAADLCEFEASIVFLHSEFQAGQGYIGGPYLFLRNYFYIFCEK